MMFSGKTMSSFESEISKETIQAYQETAFLVFAENSLELKISIKSEALLDLYRVNNSETCAFVTACNPNGEMLSDEQNLILQKQLEDEIKIRGLNFIPGEGKHPISDWPGESSFLIFDLSLESSKTLGRKFNQNAIVWCDQDAIPQLILLR